MARGKSTGARSGKARSKEAQALEDRVIDPRGTRALQGGTSATGQELRRIRDGEEIPKGKDRGNPDTPNIKPDAKPTGLQAQPARLLPNGTEDPRTIATPSGPVPVAAVSTDVASADRALENHERRLNTAGPLFGAYERLPDEVIDQMSHAELRAVAEQRGYTGVEAGSQKARNGFRAAQEQDENLS